MKIQSLAASLMLIGCGVPVATSGDFSGTAGEVTLGMGAGGGSGGGSGGGAGGGGPALAF